MQRPWLTWLKSETGKSALKENWDKMFVPRASTHAGSFIQTHLPLKLFTYLFWGEKAFVLSQKKMKHLKVSVLTENLENNAMEETNKAGK